MKLTVQRQPLLTGCQMVASAVAPRTTKPILSNIKAIAENDRLTLVAYDTEVGIRYEMRGITVTRSGSAILAITQLTQILRESDEDDVSLDADESGTKVKVGKSRFEMPAYPVDEFPDLPAFDDGGRSHEIQAGALKSLIRRTEFAADKKDSTRFALSGVLFESEPRGTLRTVGTDSKRLAVCEAKGTFHGEDGFKGGPHLIPAKAVTLVERNITDDGETARISLRPGEALFRFERVTVYTRLVEGRYPPYRDIIGQTQKQVTTAIILPRETFLSRVRQAAIMQDDESKRVDMTFEAGKVTMQARGAETGSSDVEMPLPDYTGPEIQIAFDPQHLVEFLRAIEDVEVTLEMSDGGKPALFKVGESYRHLVMPLAG